jgi:hypothetical protein
MQADKEVEKSLDKSFRDSIYLRSCLSQLRISDSVFKLI